MNISTRNKLEKLGYAKEFLESISHFRKDKRKRFELRITDVEELNDHPDKGIFVCYACFDTVGECREICEKLEGFAYILTDTQTGKRQEVGGIIDDCALEIFEEMALQSQKEITYYWGKAFGSIEAEIIARSYKTESGIRFEVGRASSGKQNTSGMRTFVATRSVICHSKEELEYEERSLRYMYRASNIYRTVEECR